MKVEIAPSILAADFGDLNKDVALVEPHSDRLHIDVMDGHFVPNISFGAPVMRCVKTELPMDAHLMIENPEKYLKDFAEAGADTIIVHLEACEELEMVMSDMRTLNVGVGVSIKPGTPVEELRGYIDVIDQILIMTVEPGFGGQKFMPDMMDKVKALREWGYEGVIGIDGGVNAETALLCKEAGADLLIAGSYVFRSDDPVAAVESLR